MAKKVCNILIELGLVALIIFPPIFFGAVLSHHISYIQLLLIVLGVIWLVKSFLKKTLTYLPSPLDLPILLLLGWGLVNFFTSTYAISTEHALYLVANYAFLYVLVKQHIKTVRRLIGLAFILVLIGSGESLFGLLQYLRGATTILGQPTPNIGTVNATYFSHNHFAGFLILVIPITLGLLVGTSNLEKKGFLALLTGLMGSALVLSLSRGGLLSFGLALGVFFLGLILKSVRRTGAWKRYLMIGLVLFIGVGGIIVWVGVSPIAHRSLLETFLPSKDTFVQEIRFSLWRNALALVKEFPLFGSGLGTFEYVFTRYVPETFPQNRQAYYAHNDYLELLIEMGLPAFLLIIWSIIRFYRHSVRAYFRHNDPVLTSLLLGGITSCTAMFIHSVFDFNLQIPANALLFTMVLAMTMATVDLLLRRRGAFRESTEQQNDGLKALFWYDSPGICRWNASWKLLLVALCILAIPVVYFRHYVATHYYARGNFFRVTRQPFAALPAYQTAIKIVPGNAAYHEVLGQLYSEIGDTTPHAEKWYQLAIEAFQQAIELNPYQAAYYYQLGQIYDELYQEAEAIRAFKTAVANHPQLAFYHVQLGHYLLYLQQTDAAISAYRQAIQRDIQTLPEILKECQTYQLSYDVYREVVPDEVERKRRFAEWLAQQGFWEASKAEYRQAVELSGYDEAVYTIFLDTCRNRQDYGCLRTMWAELAKQQPQQLQFSLNIAESFVLEQRWDDAIAHYEELFTSHPNNSGIYERLGQLYQQRGHWDQALQYYHDLIESHPENTNLYNALAGIYRQRTRWEEAIGIYQQALERGLGGPEFLSEVGRLHEQAGQPQKALMAYQKAIEAGETRFDVFLRVEHLHHQFNRSHEQLLLWETYALTNKQSPEALFHLVKHYHAQGEWLNAVTLAKEVIANTPTHPEYRQFLAALYEQQGMVLETIEQWEKLVKMHAENIGYALRLATLYEQVEDWGKARAQYRRILRLNPEHQQARQNLSKLGG